MATKRPNLPDPVEQWLVRLEEASKDLPKQSREDLRANAWKTLAQTMSRDPSPAEVDLALQLLGEPEKVAQLERERLGELPIDGVGRFERITMFWMAVSILLPVVGLVIAVAMMWNSKAFSEKVKSACTFIILFGWIITVALVTVGGGGLKALAIGALVITPCVSALILMVNYAVRQVTDAQEANRRSWALEKERNRQQRPDDQPGPSQPEMN